MPPKNMNVAEPASRKSTFSTVLTLKLDCLAMTKNLLICCTLLFSVSCMHFTPKLAVQGIIDNQTRHRRQKKLGEGEAEETGMGDKERAGSSGASQGRGKHLRVLSIKKLH